MHTVQNRVAAKTPKKGKTSTRGSRKKQAPAFMLNAGNPPAFPTGLIIPPPRGAMITAVPWPEEAAPRPRKPARPATRRKAGTTTPAVSKASSTRKARTASKAASSAPAQALAAMAPVTTAKPARPKSSRPKTAALAGPVQAQEASVAMMTEDLLDRALAMRPLPAEKALPPEPVRVTQARLPATPDSPLPRSRALSTARGQGLFDIISHLLRDFGGWAGSLIGHMNKRRGNADERAHAARAKARQHALQSQFDALEALREVAKAD
jgi:hypothetical protein